MVSKPADYLHLKVAALAIIQNHGTVPASEFLKIPQFAVVRWAVEIDCNRGRGRPSMAELARRRPRRDCLCPMCLASFPRHMPTTFEADAEETDFSDEPWRAHAACRGMGFDMFHPKLTGQPRYAAAGAEEWSQGRAVCDRCSVRQDCLEFALVNRIRDGLWGGLESWERDDYAAGTNVTVVR